MDPELVEWRCAALLKLMELDKCGPEYRYDLASSADRPAVDPYLEDKREVASPEFHLKMTLWIF